MNAQTLYDINQVCAKLMDRIRHERYADGRSGMIPPEALAQMVTDMEDAAATVAALYAESYAHHRLTLKR